MLKINKLQTFALTTAFTVAISLAKAPVVLAVMFSLNGMFDDQTSFNGSFDYDFDNNQYTSVNINTNSGLSLPGSTYNDVTSLFGGVNGFTLIDQSVEYSFTLSFGQALDPANPNPILLSVTPDSSIEADLIDLTTKRSVTSGSITPVPFEFKSGLGLLLLITFLGARKGWKYWH